MTFTDGFFRWSDVHEIVESDKRESVEAIFFTTSSRQEFTSDEDRKAFLDRWVSFYFEYCLNDFWLALKGGQIVGYLSGCANSQKALSKLGHKIPSYDLFADLFAEFPAHLHINFLPSACGLGLGSGLLQKFIADLKEQKIKGVHLITSPKARNVSFYKKNGFNTAVARKRGEIPYLFLGRRL